MTTIDDEPHSNSLPAIISFDKKKDLFYGKLLCIVDRYVIPSQFCLKQKEPIQVSITDVSNNPHLKHIMSEHDSKKSRVDPMI